MHMISMMFPTKKVVKDVNDINVRFDSVEEYKRIMYTLFVSAALHFVWNSDFVAYGFGQLSGYEHEDKPMKDIEAFVSLKRALKESLKTMKIKEKVGTEIYKLFGFLDCILHSDVQNQSKKGGPPKILSELICDGQTQNKDGGSPQKASAFGTIGVDTTNAPTQNKEGGPTQKSSELVTTGDDTSISTHSTAYCTGNKHKF